MLRTVSPNEVVLFGGAKSINELYNDTLLFKIKEKTWSKIEPTGTIPSPRAAHGACCISKLNIIVFGGAKKDKGFASNELYFLDLSSEPTWSILPTKDPKPLSRYGHSLIYHKPYLVLFGGTLKDSKLSNELWIAKLDYNSLQAKLSIQWEKVEFDDKNKLPAPRLYHSIGIVKSNKAKGMIILFGGRNNETRPLNDCWGLRRHRDSTWEWVIPPNKGETIPVKRFQHVSLFYMNYMIIIGGRSDNVDNGLPIDIYNTDTQEWHALTCYNQFRLAAFSLDKYAFLHGGYDITNVDQPSDELSSFDMRNLCSLSNNENNSGMLLQNHMIIQKSNQSNTGILYQSALSDLSQLTMISKPLNNLKAEISYVNISDDISDDIDPTTTPNLSSSSLILGDLSPSGKGICCHSRIEKPIQLNNSFISCNKKILPSEVKVVSLEEKNKYQIIENLEVEYCELYENFISTLLRQNNASSFKMEDNSPGKFKFRREHIIALTKACQEVVLSQPLVLRLSTPIKIFGDIHGQYDDLLRFFKLWGEPSEELGIGDIDTIDYLFLGDYVDRGCYSLETICLLMALKIKYPDKIHLLRGNHEDHFINYNFGFYAECNSRLSDDVMCEELNVYKVINEFFEYLPLVAIVEDAIMCLHGGIGDSFNDIEYVEQLVRPISVVHEVLSKEDQVVMDILWSDPTDHDSDLGIHNNQARDSKGYGHIVKFGPDVVKSFMEKNNIQTIIRAHECVSEGFERFCEGNLITVFSATNYCGRHQNAGAMLVLTNNLQIIPHLIYPIECDKMQWIEKDDFLKKRPPTPLRKRPKNN